ncbi:SRSO17 transposase [Haloactinospora alba]|uniref:SRSO17 transposase n=1 Tax=Haloactinospora alba TaxID=405555 RepID=A0A543N7N3_9ACTN|nr:transposase [Haloactinospora alba]TQN27841.1 SRSO17 transposase [Haloactinospora alba]
MAVGGTAPEHRRSGDALGAFTEDLFAHLPRADQRRWARTYLDGLLATDGKKTVRRMAAAVGEPPTAAQSLHQFVSASPWDWAPTRERLRRWIERRGSGRAWVVGRAFLPKRGSRSVGVHQRFDPAAGRTVNAQVGIGAFLATPEGDLPVEWRLCLPDDWLADPGTRRRARIPEEESAHLPLWRHALRLTGELAASPPRDPAPVVSDMSGVPAEHAAAFVQGLTGQGHGFAVAVPGSLPLHPAPAADGATEPSTRTVEARRLLVWNATRSPGSASLPVAVRARVVSAPVRLPRPSSAQRGDRLRLFTVLDDHGAAGRTWLTTRTGDRDDRLAALTRHPAGIDAAVGEMSDRYGLLDFEGRSFPGWHHHMTLVSAAYAYARLVAPER